MKRTEQREHIFKLIFGADFNEEAEQGTQAELYFEQIEGATEKDMQYISEKAQKVVEKIDEIDAMINEHTLSLIHISEPTRRSASSRMPSSA